jgi:hypothetical protein
MRGGPHKQQGKRREKRGLSRLFFSAERFFSPNNHRNKVIEAKIEEK